jgi:uncharacterized alkaline shock family protein YloU
VAKIIDRLLLFILSLTIIGSTCLLLLAAFGVVPYEDTVKFAHNIYYETQTAVTFIIASTIIFLIGVRMFYIAVRPSNVNTPSIDQHTDFGDIRISVDTVENLALKAAQRSRGVKDIKARVSVGPNGLEIIIRTLVDGENSIPNLSEEIQRTVKTHIEEVTGIPVAAVSVFVANIIQTNHAFKSRVE